MNDHSDYLRLIEYLEQPREWTPRDWDIWTREGLVSHDGVPNPEKLPGRWTAPALGKGYWEWQLRHAPNSDARIKVLSRVCQESGELPGDWQVAHAFVENTDNPKRETNPRQPLYRLLVLKAEGSITEEVPVGLIQAALLRVARRLKAALPMVKPFKCPIEEKSASPFDRFIGLHFWKGVGADRYMSRPKGSADNADDSPS